MRKLSFAALGLVLLLVMGAVSAQGINCPAFQEALAFTYVPLEDETVNSVSLRGSFNNWGEWPMEERPDGSWSITICLEFGSHQYKFFINGQWPGDMATARDGGPVDPKADKYVDDGFGGQNAVRIVQPREVPGPAPVHNANDPAFLSIADGRLVLRLRTMPDVVSSVRLITGEGSFPMERQLWWEFGEIWRASIPAPESSLEYRFVGVAFDGARHTTFFLPEDPKEHFYFDGVDPFPQLTWVGQSVFYQLFPERFRDGNPENNARALETSMVHYNVLWEELGWYRTHLSAWSDPMSPQHCCHQYFGGDLAGITEKLPYLAELGITALYLNPIFESGSAHGFDTHDYREVCPKFGTKDDLRLLLAKAQVHGMRVIFDFVPNHTGLGFWAFQDIVEKGPASPYWDWYMVHQWPFRPGDAEAYEAWWDLGSLPQLNTANPAVKEYLFDVVRYWLEFGFDGLRVDVPGDVIDAHTFFAEMRRRVRAEHPDAYLVAEIWSLSPAWVQGDQFDSLMNYALGREILLPYAQGNFAGEHTLAELSRYFAAYGENVAAMGFNLVSSHDTGRVLTDLGGGNFGETPALEAIERLKLLSTLLYSMPGAPVTFQGDERGILGEQAPFDAHRYPIQWEVVNDELLAHYTMLAEIRRELPALTSSVIRAYRATENLLAFFRGERGENEALVVANNGLEAATFELPAGVWRSAAEHEVLQGVIAIPPLQVRIFVRALSG